MIGCAATGAISTKLPAFGRRERCLVAAFQNVVLVCSVRIRRQVGEDPAALRFQFQELVYQTPLGGQAQSFGVLRLERPVERCCSGPINRVRYMFGKVGAASHGPNHVILWRW